MNRRSMLLSVISGLAAQLATGCTSQSLVSPGALKSDACCCSCCDPACVPGCCPECPPDCQPCCTEAEQDQQ